MHCVFHLRQAACQDLRHRLENRFQMFLLLEPAQRRIKCAARVDLIGLQDVYRALHCIQQGLRVGQPAVVGIDLLPFAGLRRQFFELANLPTQPFAFALQRILGRERVGKQLTGQPPRLPAR